MQNCYRIAADLGCIFIKGPRNAEPGGLIRRLNEIRQLPEFRRGMNFAVDYRGTDFSRFSYEVFMLRVDLWAALCEKLGPCKIATINDTALNYAIGRQAATFYENTEVELMPFLDPALAALWLDIPLDRIDATLQLACPAA